MKEVSEKMRVVTRYFSVCVCYQASPVLVLGKSHSQLLYLRHEQLTSKCSGLRQESPMSSEA